jgi:hypothetical protein
MSLSASHNTADCGDVTPLIMVSLIGTPRRPDSFATADQARVCPTNCRLSNCRPMPADPRLRRYPHRLLCLGSACLLPCGVDKAQRRDELPQDAACSTLAELYDAPIASQAHTSGGWTIDDVVCALCATVYALRAVCWRASPCGPCDSGLSPRRYHDTHAICARSLQST